MTLRLAELRSQNVLVAHGVDAAMLADTMPAHLKGMRFDRVVWNYPSAHGAEDGDDEANATLLARLFLSLTDAILHRLVSRGCALTLTFQGDQFSRWRVACAARSAFWYTTRVCSDLTWQPYTPVRASSGVPIPMDGSARRYEFRCPTSFHSLSHSGGTTHSSGPPTTGATAPPVALQS